jgi:hypothetical protein
LPAFLAPCVFLVLAVLQPVTATGVVCSITAPFWPVKTVGIVSLCLQRFTVALRAE